jgi:hypothetical protein
MIFARETLNLFLQILNGLKIFLLLLFKQFQGLTS